ncbi:arginase [Haloplanus aerogenes]|uniref:Arginase n=1 Tax=Haloplanus aerogenes TaxID=660522 RepID=A0A3G8QTQ5_9EURY|nr:arginase [Haloplanus aerogenes]AZH25836.1 arginase [Haloplanus aerogenes]RMB25581.1 arginase [Haloplanus aerogenes]
MSDTIRILGAPTDYGASRRGVDMGPSAIRYAGLAATLSTLGVDPLDAGDLSVPPVEADDPGRADAKYLPAIESVCTELADRVADALADGDRPLVLGGDHSVAIGSVVGSTRDADIGVLWFDAHGDLNTPATTPSGNVHGMALAALLGHGEFASMSWTGTGIDPENVALVGVRDLDPGEREAIRDHGITTFSISEIDRRGVTSVVEDALDVVTGRDGVHVSLDLDWIDPTEAPGVGTPVRGGVTYREAHAALERVADEATVRSLELVEVNPILDDHNRTAELAIELAASALGKQIL